VRLHRRVDGPALAQPLIGGSGNLTTLMRADGLVRIPPGSAGLEAGELVLVHLALGAPLGDYGNVPVSSRLDADTFPAVLSTSLGTKR
jgi:hypothetical protein